MVMFLQLLDPLNLFNLVLVYLLLYVRRSESVNIRVALSNEKIES